MKTSDKPILRGTILSHSVLAAALALAGCGGSTVFSGQMPMTIGGDLPPPPPPPPPPPKEEPKPPPRVELKQDKIQINEKVQFEYNSSQIKEESHSLLNEVATVIKDHPFIKKILVEGHASSDGADDYNMRLSDARAKAVRDYLVNQAGIAPERLEAKGFGETKPIASNDTEEGREQNRRVEFNITEQDEAARKKAEEAGSAPAAAPAEGEAPTSDAKPTETGAATTKQAAEAQAATTPPTGQ